jgi:microcystin-dependent protein
MPFLGEIRAFASDLPQNWLPCDGRELAINGNQALFSTLGTRYGGNGRTTFALPDLRGRVVAGADSGLDQRNGATSGSGAEHPSLIPYTVARWGISVAGEYPTPD